MAAKSDNLRKAKEVNNDEFYISSSCILLSFHHDDGNDICNRETSGFYEGGAF